MAAENGLFSKIEPYWSYWVKDFPLMIDKNTAVDDHKFIAICDNETILTKKPPLGQISINFSLLYSLILKLKKIQRIIEKEFPHQYDRQLNLLRISTCSPDLLLIEPEKCEILLLIGSPRDFTYIEKEVETSPVDFPYSSQWGKSQRIDESLLISVKNLKEIVLVCKKSDGSKLEWVKSKSKWELTINFDLCLSVFQKIKKYESFLLQYKRSTFEDINLCLFQDFLGFIPTFSQKAQNFWGIYLAKMNL